MHIVIYMVFGRKKYKIPRYLFFLVGYFNNGDVMNILITGARSGIAHALIDTFIKRHNQGDVIYAAVKNEIQKRRLEAEYEHYNWIKSIVIDITKQTDREKVRELDIDVLVANAAIGKGGSVLEMPVDEIRYNFEVNVFSNVELVQLVLKQMLEKKKGKIIVMASLAGLVPIPFLGSYCATKASLIHLSTSLRYELKERKSKIDVILIEPGLYHTGFNQLMFEDKYDRKSFQKYFDAQIAQLQKREYWVEHYLEKKRLDTIVKKIREAIEAEHPKKIYRSPLLQVLGSKIYQLFLL